MTDADPIKTLENAQSSPPDPLPLFRAWLGEAEQSEVNDPNAMCLATIDADGKPSARIVLLKQYDARGFVFFTNRTSRKGQALAAHPFAALNFHWKSLQRAVRIEGRVEKIEDEESDTYYYSRNRGSRIGAWASKQSQPLESRTVLRERVAEMDQRYGDDIPRPPHWGGYRVVPDRIEFWHDGADRLHTRLLYIREPDGTWRRTMLYP